MTRTYKEIIAGSGGISNTSRNNTPSNRSSGEPVTVVVNGEAMRLTLGTGLTPIEKGAGTRNATFR